MGHHHGHTSDSTGNLRVAFFINLSFTIFEIIGGIWTNSIAITADALHDLGDSISLGMSWGLDRYSKKGEDRRYSYGYRRFSLLGALVNTIVLIVGGLFILSQAIPRLVKPEPAHATGMMIFAIIGVVVNGLAVLRLQGSKSLNVQVVMWHLLEDVLGWVAVLVVSIVLLFTNLYILDSILSVLITLYILYNVLGNLRKTVALFLQAIPDGINIADVESKLLAIDKVLSTHHTHIWSLDGEHNVLTTHVVVDETTLREEIYRIKREVIKLAQEVNCEHVTVEIEYENEDCRVKQLA